MEVGTPLKWLYTTFIQDNRPMSIINVRKYRSDYQEWKIQRNWPNRVHKREKKNKKKPHSTINCGLAYRVTMLLEYAKYN